MKEFDFAKNENIIREGWYAGIIISIISLLMLFIGIIWNNHAVFGTEDPVYYDIVDIVGIFALSNGLLQKSRICAVILPVYFLAVRNSQFLALEFPFNLAGFLGLLLFASIFYRSAVAVFKYHKFSPAKNFHPGNE
jgi:hypothetical protein